MLQTKKRNCSKWIKRWIQTPRVSEWRTYKIHLLLTKCVLFVWLWSEIWWILEKKKDIKRFEWNQIKIFFSIKIASFFPKLNLSFKIEFNFPIHVFKFIYNHWFEHAQFLGKIFGFWTSSKDKRNKQQNL